MKFIRVLKAEEIVNNDKQPYRQFKENRDYIIKINRDYTNIQEELIKFKNIMSSTILAFYEEHEGEEHLDASYEVFIKFAKTKYGANREYNIGAISIYAAYKPYDSEKSAKPSIEAYCMDDGKIKKFMNVTTNNIEQLAKKIDHALNVISHYAKYKAENELELINDKYY